MDLGVVFSIFHDKSLEQGLVKCAELGIRHVELGAGGFYPKTHCDPRSLLDDSTERKRFLQLLAGHQITVSALAIHGEPLHPDPERQSRYAADFADACRLAGEVGIGRLTLLAGLPEGAPGDSTPTWITYPFPNENVERLEWQWTERLLPYWETQTRLAREHGVRLCFEMHPNDLVYNPPALLRLRSQLGDVVGANLDPSHLLWQGMEMADVIDTLGDAIYHAHAKDARFNDPVRRRRGVLDPGHQGKPGSRAWNFRTVGYGEDALFWREFVSRLRQVGYDDVVSIEHEDALIDPIEGLERAVAFLRPIVPTREFGSLWFR